MTAARLFLPELGRLLKNRLTWLIALLTILSPAAGLTLYRPAEADTMMSMYLANPSLAGGAAGAILFGLLTVYELDRAGRSRADVLLDAAVSPLTMALVRLLSMIAAAVWTLAAAMLVWFPVSKKLIGSVLGATDFVLAYALFMGLAMALGILAASSAFLLTRRADLASVLLIVFAGLSLTVWADDWQLCWLNPCVWALSDDFSNFRIFRSVAYMRFTWLLALSGVWTLSWLCVRQYKKGLFGSFFRNVRRILRPAVALCLLGCCALSWAAQPMVDHSDPDETKMSFSEIPYLDKVAYVRRLARVFPDTDAGTLRGTATYWLQNASGEEQTVAFGINPGYEVRSVTANGTKAPFRVGTRQEFNEALLEVEIPEADEVELTVEYGGFPRENGNLAIMQGSMEISDEYICLENANLSPRLMNVPPGEEGYPAAIEITLPDTMTVIPFGTGQADAVDRGEGGTLTWRYESNGTGGILYAGDYIRQDIRAGGIDLEFYYGRKHRDIMEASGAADAVKSVVDYCTGHYGALSFLAGNSLKLIQSRVSGGGYATNGASLLDEQDFTAANLSDTEKGAVPGEVMIHELGHQWWGLGNMFDVSDGTDDWSAEGLTVYTTWRIVKELYGEAYARENYVERWQEAVDDYYLNFYVRNPQYLEMLPEKERAKIDNSLTWVRRYCEMPLKILKAQQLVGGEESMDRILRGLFNRELDPASPWLTKQDFLDACGLTEEEINLG